MNRKLKIYNPADVKPNKTSIMYLYEVYAVPAQIRKAYLDKLLKRKNSGRQKNIRLLKIIYGIIKSEDFNSWDIGKICSELDMTVKQLYWHKHKILKGLRELYFGWKEIEQKINQEMENNISSSENKTRDRSTNNVQYLLLKTKRMYGAGMRREAKNIFLSLSNTLEKKFNDRSPDKDDILMLSETYEHILEYYYEQRNLVRYDLFLKKLEWLTLAAEKKVSKITKEQKSILKIRFFYAEAYRHKFLNYNNASVFKVKKYLEKAFYEARSTNHTHYKILILYKIYLAAEKLGEEETMANSLQEGYKLSGHNNYKLEHIAYKSSLIYREFINSEIKDVKYLKKLKKYFKESGEINPVNQDSIYCTDNYLKALLHFKPYKFNGELKKLVKRQVLFSQTAIARWNLYQLKLNIGEFYSHKIVNDNTSGKHFITIGEVYYDRLKKREELANETLLRLNNVHSVNLKIHVLTVLLESEFWKGKNCDFEKVLSIIKRIEWIWKSKKVSQNRPEFYLMKLGILMMYKSTFCNKNEVLNKYFQNFIKISNNLLKKTENNVLVSYSLICLIAQQLDYKEVWDIIRRHYSWLEENHPKLIGQFEKYIKDRETGKKEKQDSTKAA